MKTYENFTEAYVDLLKSTYENPEHNSAPRGMKVRESLGVSFRIKNARDRIPFVDKREFSISYMIAELIWYISGNNSTEWIANYSAFWRNISDDGQTANSAYGARIFKQHPYQLTSQVPQHWSQWNYVLDELNKDPDSRRAVIHIRQPQDSYLASKDVPCTLSLQFFIRDGALHQVASMRSSDLILGLAYDVPAFTFFQEMLAAELQVDLGSYTHMSNSLHVYEKHFDMVKTIIETHDTSKQCHVMPPMPGKVPIDDLVKFEARLRSAHTEQELQKIVAEFSAMHVEYWSSWIKVLASHRAKKLSLDPNKFLSQSQIQCYRSFIK